jgi:prophage endopeptidase
MEALVTQYKWVLILLACLLVAGTSGFATWKVDSWRYGKQLAEESAAYQADLATISNAAAAQSRQALAKQQTAEQAVAALDQKSIQEKDTLNAENESLRRAVAAGDHRLHIAGTCSAISSNVPGTARATGLGDATTVELAPTAGQSVFDIRAGIIADQAALRAAQAYIRDVCRAE